MGGRSKKQTVGYRYYLGMHMVICHGPVDAVTEIQVADRPVWSGNLLGSGRITLDEPELFGGEKREGGIAGDVDVAFGQSTQTPNDYLISNIGKPQPAYRGLLDIQPGFSDTRPEDSPHESPPPPDTLFFVDRYNES